MESLSHSGACGLQEGKGGSNQIRAGQPGRLPGGRGTRPLPCWIPLSLLTHALRKLLGFRFGNGTWPRLHFDVA